MRRFLLPSAMLVALFAIPLYAQTSGEVTGHISDPSGAAVPGAKISLTNIATNAVRTAVSTGSGDYTFPTVAPGMYSVKVEMAGFKTASSNVQVQIQQAVRLDFALALGQVSETVEVTASTPLLQSETASLGTVIEN